MRVKDGMSLWNGRWHGLRDDIIMWNVIYAEWPIFCANQFANAAAVLMLHDDNQKSTNANCRLAFSAQLQRFFLTLLVGLHGSTDTTARKSAIEEKMFWKVTLPSALIFCAKDVRTINLTVSFYLYLYLQPREKCFFFRRWVTWSWHKGWTIWFLMGGLQDF